MSEELDYKKRIERHKGVLNIAKWLLTIGIVGLLIFFFFSFNGLNLYDFIPLLAGLTALLGGFIALSLYVQLCALSKLYIEILRGREDERK